MNMNNQFKNEINQAVINNTDLLEIREILLDYKNNGMDKQSMLSEINSMRIKSNPETEDVLLELLDFIEGYCNPSLAVFD